MIISMLNSGHLFNHSSLDVLKKESENNGIILNTNLHKYLFSKDKHLDKSLIDDADILFLNNFDVLTQDPKKYQLLQDLRQDFPNKIIVGFAQELPHYINSYNAKSHLLDHTIGIAHQNRMPSAKNYHYFPFPVPSQNIYSTSHKIYKKILLSGAFRLARAQLYYQLMEEKELQCYLFYTKNRMNATQYESGDSMYPVNFKEKFQNRVIDSKDASYSDYIKNLYESQIVVNYSRQINNLEGFHTSLKHNMANVLQKKDFEFISTRVRECALSHTLCICNYDKIYELSGLNDGEHLIMYDSYNDLVDKLKWLSNCPNICANIGNNLCKYYKANYTDIHLIKKIKEICS